MLFLQSDIRSMQQQELDPRLIDCISSCRIFTMSRDIFAGKSMLASHTSKAVDLHP